MFVALLRITLVTTGLVTGVVIASAGLVSAAPIAFPVIQNGWPAYVALIGTESQRGSYFRLTGATVRDHRSNSGGTYNTNTTPQSAVSPGRGEGGVGHAGYPQLGGGYLGNPRDHRIPYLPPPGGN